MERCVKHSPKVHLYIQHIIEQRKRSVEGGGLWVLAVRLSCQQIDAILDHVSTSAEHNRDHAVAPSVWENYGVIDSYKVPNLSCNICRKFLTLAVEDAYLHILKKYIVQKKQSPRS